MLTCGSPWLIAAYRVLRRQSVPWHPPCALVRLIFACYSYSPKTSTSTDTRCSLLPCQVRITTVFTLPISTDSDWNLPLPQLKALFVFPTFSLCSFQGALKSLPYALSIVSPILQNDTVFHQCQKHQICQLFRALNSFRCLFVVSVPLFSYILTSFPLSGCST